MKELIIKKKNGNTVVFMIVCLILFSCNNSIAKKETFIDSNIKMPFVKLDSMNLSKGIAELYLTDSLSFFNPTYNGQCIAVIGEQIDLKSKDFLSVKFHINMPLREDGAVNGQFSYADYQKLRNLYFNDSLKVFSTDLLELNWDSREIYTKNYTTLLDRVNVTFQEEIRKNFADEYPGGSQWYGFNSFIIFNDYLMKPTESNTQIIQSLLNNPNDYLKKEDIDELMKLIEKAKLRIGNGI